MMVNNGENELFPKRKSVINIGSAAKYTVKINRHSLQGFSQEQVGTPQKLTQLSPRSHPRHLVGKRTAQKDTIIDTTSDSQVNSNIPHRWSPASLTFNNYFYLFLYLYITRITVTINNNTPHLKSPKNQNRRAALGWLAMKLLGGLQLFCGRPNPALSSALVPQTILKNNWVNSP